MSTLNYDGKRGPINATVNDPAMQRQIDEQRRRSEVGSRVNVPAAIAPNTKNTLVHRITEAVDTETGEQHVRSTTKTVRENH